MIKLDIKDLVEIKNEVSSGNKEIIDEFLQVCKKTNDPDELDEYVDLLLGIAEEVDESNQSKIYKLIDNIQKLQL